MGSKSKYEIKSALGQGGMGAVYRAVHKELKRPCALKVLKPELVSHSGARKRFEREVQVMAALNHPNIVKIFDAGISPRGCYMAMELVPGQSLDRILKAKGALPLEEAVAIGEAILQALAYIHERKVVHRDLKPANVMVTEEGQVKVMDFGLVFVDDRTSLTRTGEAVGTIRYMPPEMLRGGKSDARSDIYQWAAIFYECLTGEYFCSGKNQGELVLEILEGEIPSVRALHPEFPEALDRVIAWAGDRNPDNRPDDAETLRLALLKAVGHDRASVDLSRTVTDLPSLDALGLPPADMEEFDGDSTLTGQRKASGAFRRATALHPRPREGKLSGSRPGKKLAAVLLLLTFAVLGVAGIVSYASRTKLRPRLQRLRAEPFSCRVFGVHTPNTVVPWRIKRSGKVLREGKVSSASDGNFEITIRGLEDGGSYRVYLGDVDQVLQGRQFRTPGFAIEEGPWVRTGPTWLEMRWKANAPCELELHGELRRSQKRWSGTRRSRLTKEGRILFTGIPFDQSPASRLRLSLRRGNEVLSRSDVSLCVRDVVHLPKWSDLDEPMSFAPGSAGVGNTVVFADASGLVYGMDLKQLFLFPSPERLPLAWLETLSPRPGRERSHTRSKSIPASGGCFPWRDKVVAIGNRPPSLRVFLPEARKARFEMIRKALDGIDPFRVLSENSEKLDRLLVETPPLWGEGEYVLPLKVFGASIYGAAVGGNCIYMAWSSGRESTICAVDLETRSVVAHSVLPGAVSGPVQLVRDEVLVVLRRADRSHWLHGLGRKDLDPRWSLACAARPTDRFWIPEGGEFFTLCDTSWFYKLQAPSSVRGVRQIDEEAGEWKVSAKVAQSAPRRVGDRWYVPYPGTVKRFFEERGLPLLGSFRPGALDDDWNFVELPGAIVNRFSDVQTHALDIHEGVFTFIFDFDCFAVRVPEGECLWVCTSGNRPSAPPLVHQGVLFNAHQSGRVWALPLHPQD